MGTIFKLVFKKRNHFLPSSQIPPAQSFFPIRSSLVLPPRKHAPRTLRVRRPSTPPAPSNDSPLPTIINARPLPPAFLLRTAKPHTATALRHRRLIGSSDRTPSSLSPWVPTSTPTSARSQGVRTSSFLGFPCQGFMGFLVTWMDLHLIVASD
jgi:hypothetical protein